ncbi:DUF5916 domain-containing protein [Gracilimonas halophila]|uniref:DUF5916 domain-containing protein n=1 Tax=Gracilimonas halophila TaxID=1834464 RepID=A0ABW5JKV6_9BACT
MRNIALVLIMCVTTYGKECYSQSIQDIYRLSEEITLDGVLEEQAWQEISPFPMTQYEPVFEGGLSERTEIMVAYDDEYFYVAGRMFTEDVTIIAANSLYRDSYSGDDVFAVILDPFNDNQNALRFFTTPAGVRFDQTISNDANDIAGASAVNSSWNTFWDVATSQDEQGWYAEIRIPFSSIGFQSNEGTAEMGLIVYRWIAHHNERHTYPAIPPNWDRGEIKPSQAADIRLKNVDARRPVYFTPYVLTGYQQQNQLNSTGDSYEYENDFERNVGFDVKYNVTSNLTLDVTANTDFAQVEADEQQLNLSRFSITFPEKRQFFQQRSGLFTFNFGNTRLFYSRRIGLDNQGNQVPIYGGVRLTGRVDDWDIGVLNMQTASSEILPSENFGVIRLKKNVLNPGSYIGSIFTSRVGADGNSNYVFGLDGDFNISGDDFIEVKVSQSMDNQVAESERYNFTDNSIFRITWQRRASVGLFYRFFVNRTGSEFDPGIGFFRTINTSDYFYRIGYGWFSDENSIFKSHSINVGSFNIFENETFDLRSRFISPEWRSDFKDGSSFSLNARFNQEHLLPNEDFELLGQIYIPVDDYNFFDASVSYNTTDNKKLRNRFTLEYGEIFDGRRFLAKINPRWIANIHFELDGSYQITKLDFPDRFNRATTDFTVHLAQLRGQYAFNKKLSTSAFIQYSNVNELAGLNMRLRYYFREGQDLWVVYNETINTIRDQMNLGSPRLPFMENRAILLKYTHTFDM